MPPSEPQHELQRDDVELVATEFIENFRDGVAPPIEGYIERYPHLAETIADLFPMIAALESMKKEDDRETARSATSRPLHLSELGDFKIVKEIGRGGMGVVYQAFQETLDRHVALKVLPQASLLDADFLKRFRQEARMAARLHHSNIVSLYGMGEHRGYHFLVMELVDGESLDSVIRWLKNKSTDRLVSSDPSKESQFSNSATEAWEHDRFTRIAGHLRKSNGKPDWFAVACLARDAAQSLQYAFEQSVLHRDIKPANLLLDVDGRIWISDFGLAQPLTPDPNSERKQSGGTPRYLPPEAIDGVRDHSSDVYSLGLTVYELLTLKPAFTESTPEETVARVEDSARNLVAPSVVDGSIPADLEAIVLKTIENDPADRYLTAGHLADDLDRYIEGFPVKARPVGSIMHGIRWCQRNPFTAGLLGLVGSLLLMIAVISSAGFVNTLAAKEEVSNAFQREKHARRALESTLKVATDALDDIYEQFSPDRLQDGFAGESLDSDSLMLRQQETVLSEDTAAVLESLLGFYDTLASQSGESLQIRRAAARAKQRLGGVHLQLGQIGQARGQFESSLSAWKKISDSLPADSSSRLAMATVMNELGRLEEMTEHHESSLVYHMLAAETMDSMDEDNADLVYERARALYFLGRPPSVTASVVAMEQLSDSWRRPSLKPPHKESLRGEAKRRPPPPRRPGGFEQMGDEQFLQSAVTLLGQFPQYKNQARFQFLLACCYRDLEQVDDSGYRENFERPRNLNDIRYEEMANFLLLDLVNRFPTNPSYRYELVETLRRSKDSPFGSFDQEREQEKAFDIALSNANLLVRRHPNQPRYLEARMHVFHRMGHSLSHQLRAPHLSEEDRENALAAAVGALENASADIGTLVERWPDVALWRLWEVVVEASVAEAQLLAGDKAKSLEHVTNSVNAFERICKSDACRAKYAEELPSIQRVLVQFARKVDSLVLEARLMVTHDD